MDCETSLVEVVREVARLIVRKFWRDCFAELWVNFIRRIIIYSIENHVAFQVYSYSSPHFVLSHHTSLSLFGDLFKNEEPISLPKFFQKYRRKYRRILHSNSKLHLKINPEGLL